VAYILVTRSFNILLGHCIDYVVLYINTYVKINKLKINHKTRTKSNRRSDSPVAFKLQYSVTFRVNLIVTVTCKYTDSIDNSIIIAHKGKFLTVFN